MFVEVIWPHNRSWSESSLCRQRAYVSHIRPRERPNYPRRRAHMKARLVLVLVTAAAAITTVTVAGATGAPTAQPFKVTSTLDGRKTLPRHIHWYADAPSTTLRGIDF